MTSVGDLNKPPFAYSGLTTAVITDGVTSVPDYIFKDCENLTSVTIPEGVTYIGSHAFYGCTNLINVTIPSTVTSIGDLNRPAFADTGLTTVVIADGATSVPDNAFKACGDLISVTIPASVISIGSKAFNDCTSLTTVIYNGITYTSKADIEAALTDANVTYDSNTSFPEFATP